MKTVRTRSVEPCEWPVRCGCLTAFTAERSDLRGYTYGYESEGLEHVEEVSYVRCPRCRAMHIVSMRDALRKADETPFPRSGWQAAEAEKAGDTRRWSSAMTTPCADSGGRWAEQRSP